MALVFFPIYLAGLVSYSLSYGEERSKDDRLQDLTYDGSVVGGKLTGGLGQLTDGEIGHNNFRVDYNGQGPGLSNVKYKRCIICDYQISLKLNF